MPSKPQTVAWKGKIRRAGIPAGRDPFINTPLQPLTPDAKGNERFWISTWNSNVGCLAALVNEWGDYRIYRFPEHGGFYSAAQEDDDTLWLCISTAYVVRLSLKSGKYERFETGAPGGLAFSGMAYDRETGKLFFSAHTPPTITAVSFDIRTRKTVKIYSGFSDDNYIRSSLPNGDGTYTVVFYCPGVTFARWDPRAETIAAHRIYDEQTPQPGGFLCFKLIGDDRGRLYVPHRGWFKPATGEFDAAGPTPEKELTWFARQGNLAYGTDSEAGGSGFFAWDLATGRVKQICAIPDGVHINVRLTASGKLICVNVFGEFFRLDAATGAVECSRRLPTDSIGSVDCLLRLDRERLLGTPFITQRFWELNLKTGRGFDCGRAAPGYGEVLQTWKIGGKAYLAAYGGGELVEYDPQAHPHFPENPRVVADPPGGMRPIAAADDGRQIFYSCSAEYGSLGSVLTKYDTRTGRAVYVPHPLPNQMIVSLLYDRATKTLLGGTSRHADCRSHAPAEKVCYVARLRADDLSVLEKFPVAHGADWISMLAPLSRGRWLCQVGGAFAGGEGMKTFEFSADDFQAPPFSAWQAVPSERKALLPAGRPGWFVIQNDDRVELWDWRKHRRVKLLAQDKLIRRIFVQEDSIYLVHQKEILVLEDCLKT